MRAIVHLVVFDSNSNTVDVESRLHSLRQATEISHDIITSNMVWTGQFDELYYIWKLTRSSQIGASSSVQNNSGVSRSADGTSLNDNVLGATEIHCMRAQVAYCQPWKSYLDLSLLEFFSRS